MNQKLFDHMYGCHGLTLLETELWDIISIACEEMNDKHTRQVNRITELEAENRRFKDALEACNLIAKNGSTLHYNEHALDCSAIELISGQALESI